MSVKHRNTLHENLETTFNSKKTFLIDTVALCLLFQPLAATDVNAIKDLKKHFCAK